MEKEEGGRPRGSVRSKDEQGKRKGGKWESGKGIDEREKGKGKEVMGKGQGRGKWEMGKRNREKGNGKRGNGKGENGKGQRGSGKEKMESGKGRGK
jgi:hypothetical protein